MKTNEIGYFTYFAELGFNQHINVGSRASSTGSGLSKDLVSKEINLFNMSYFFGGGVEYNIGGQPLWLAAFSITMVSLMYYHTAAIRQLPII